MGSKSLKKKDKSEKIRIILDTDANNELDDQHAIAYMLFNDSIFDVEDDGYLPPLNNGNEISVNVNVN